MIRQNTIINTEPPQKHINCPVCEEPLSPGEYNEQECWGCGWQAGDIIQDSAEKIAHNRQIVTQNSAVSRGLLPFFYVPN